MIGLNSNVNKGYARLPIIIPPYLPWMMFGLAILWILSRPILVYARLRARNPIPKNLQPQGGGIVFDIKVTKDDLGNEKMMTEIKSLMMASQEGQTKPKKINPQVEMLQQLMSLQKGGAGGGIGGMGGLGGMLGDDIK